MEKQKVDHCIRHEGKYHNVGVYVVVVMDGECPVEVGVSLAFGDTLPTGMSYVVVMKQFADIEAIANSWLSCGGPITGLLRFLHRPPCEVSGIIGDALIAAMEG